MTASSVQQNLIPNEPTLSDLLKLFKKELLLNFNAHHIAKIQMFNPLTQTATASINYKKTFFEPNIVTGVYAPKLKNYPLLVDCPVLSIGGGGGALTFPISQGDDCLVCFNDRDLDNWLQGSSTSGVATPRLHSFSDGVILVGLRSIPNALINFSTDAIELRTEDGLTKISIKKDGSKITAKVGPLMTLELTPDGKVAITNGVGELIAILSKLFEDVATGTVTTLLGEQLVKMPAFPIDKLVLDSFKA